MMGTGLKITHTYSIEDGLLDCFVIDRRTSTRCCRRRALPRAPGPGASMHFRQARTVSLDADPDQPIWADGEYVGRTPVKIDVSRGR